MLLAPTTVRGMKALTQAVHAAAMLAGRCGRRGDAFQDAAQGGANELSNDVTGHAVLCERCTLASVFGPGEGAREGQE